MLTAELFDGAPSDGAVRAAAEPGTPKLGGHCRSRLVGRLHVSCTAALAIFPEEGRGVARRARGLGVNCLFLHRPRPSGCAERPQTVSTPAAGRTPAPTAASCELSAHRHGPGTPPISDRDWTAWRRRAGAASTGGEVPAQRVWRPRDWGNRSGPARAELVPAGWRLQWAATLAAEARLGAPRRGTGTVAWFRER